MDDDKFWSLIARLRGHTDSQAMNKLVTELSSLPDDELTAFADRVAKAVYDLDAQAHFRQPITTPDFEPDDVDEDLFVSVRCAVVASGQQAYETVLRDPAELTKRDTWPISDAEGLLHVSDKAYRYRTGQDWTHAPAWRTETGDNAAGWPPAEEAAASSAEPVERIQLDLAFTDDKIARLSDKDSWSDLLNEVTERVLAGLAADAEITAELDALGLESVWVTVDFIGPKAKPVNRVKRRKSEVEVQMGRHLPKEQAQDEPQLASWLDTYLRDSLTLLLTKLKTARR